VAPETRLCRLQRRTADWRRPGSGKGGAYLVNFNRAPRERGIRHLSGWFLKELGKSSVGGRSLSRRILTFGKRSRDWGVARKESTQGRDPPIPLSAQKKTIKGKKVPKGRNARPRPFTLQKATGTHPPQKQKRRYSILGMKRHGKRGGGGDLTHYSSRIPATVSH